MGLKTFKTPLRARGLPPRALTLLELLVVCAILAVLAAVAVPNFLLAQTRTKVSVSRNNLRVLADAIEVYRVDHGAYPAPRPSYPADPFGIVAASALRCLTTPIAYATSASFRDPFGSIKVQLPSTSGAWTTGNMSGGLEPPTPGFNNGQSMLFFSYPVLSDQLGLEALRRDAFAVVSVGPDLKDSFIVYLPYPEALPNAAAAYGIQTVNDTVYDPTNGTVSGGDIAGFGGELNVSRLVGGGPR